MRCGSPRSFPALAEQLAAVQQKLNKLARGYLDELIDEESYQAAKADLVIAKAELKRSKEQLHRNRSGFWNEPAKEIINTLELAGKLQTAKSPQEISQVVHKVGTNRLLSRKTVTFFFPNLSISSRRYWLLGLWPCQPPHRRSATKLVEVLYGASGRTRTCNLLIRSQKLYPIELRMLKAISALLLNHLILIFDTAAMTGKKKASKPGGQ